MSMRWNMTDQATNYDDVKRIPFDGDKMAAGTAAAHLRFAAEDAQRK